MTDHPPSKVKQTPPSVLVVYPYMQHYRYGVFSALDQSAAEYTFASDTADYQGIAALPHDAVSRHVKLHTKYWKSLMWQRGLFHHLRGHSYDRYVLYGDVRHISTWVAAAMLRIQHKKVAFWTIGWHRPERGAKRIVRLTFYRLAQRLLLYGNVAKNIGIQQGFPEARMSVIRNSHVSPGSAVQERKPDGPELESHIATTFPTIGAVIRLTSVKKLELLLKAAALLGQQGKPVTVLLTGDGPERKRLQDLAAELHVDTRFLGAVYDTESLRKIMEATRVTVVPAAAGLTVIQSMAHGVPVISDDDAFTQMPEWEAIVNGVTGSTYDAGNPDSLASEIESWINRLSTDRQLVAANCRLEVETNWTPQVQADLINKALFNV